METAEHALKNEMADELIPLDQIRLQLKWDQNLKTKDPERTPSQSFSHVFALSQTHGTIKNLMSDLKVWYENSENEKSAVQKTLLYMEIDKLALNQWTRDSTAKTNR